MIDQIETFHIIIMLCLFCITTFGFVFLTTYTNQNVSVPEYLMLSVLNIALSIMLVIMYGPVLVLTGLAFGIFLFIYLCKKLTHYIMLNLKKSD